MCLRHRLWKEVSSSSIRLVTTHVSLPYSRTVLTITSITSRTIPSTLPHASGPWRRQPIVTCAEYYEHTLIGHYHLARGSVPNSETSSPVQWRLHRHVDKTWELEHGLSDHGPGLPSRITEAAELEFLVLRHVRGLGVHHAQFFSYDLVSPLTERFGRNAGKKMLAHVGLRGQTFSHRGTGQSTISSSSFQVTLKCRGPLRVR
jgi:hypothetical protein